MRLPFCSVLRTAASVTVWVASLASPATSVMVGVAGLLVCVGHQSIVNWLLMKGVRRECATFDRGWVKGLAEEETSE